MPKKAHRGRDVKGAEVGVVFPADVGAVVEEPLQDRYGSAHQTRFEHGRAPRETRGVNVRPLLQQPLGNVEPMMPHRTG